MCNDFSIDLNWSWSRAARDGDRYYLVDDKIVRYARRSINRIDTQRSFRSFDEIRVTNVEPLQRFFEYTGAKVRARVVTYALSAANGGAGNDFPNVRY